MPSLSRRRETDSRADRLESEVRVQELTASSYVAQRKFQCGRCKRLYEERSRTCPRCDARTMGELKPIPERHLDEAQRNAVRRAQARLGR